MADRYNVLVIGGGGREHAIIWVLSKSSKVNKLYCLPGNAGITQLAHCQNIAATDIDGILAFLDEHKDINYVVVAPDDPLAMGLVDILNQKGYMTFGPKKDAAIIESSKAYAKSLMKKYNIPTADYEIFDNYDKAIKYLKTAKYPLVVKADGLALGKGVIICQDFDTAQTAVQDMIIDKKFGASGNKVVIEEFIKGFEVSVLAFTDGQTLVTMPPSQDHKRVFDQDLGPNTGGMGTFAPSPKFTKQMQDYAYHNIFMPTIKALQAENRSFSGVIFFGLIIDGDDIKVLEYNARFGDPEAQSVLPLLKTDLFEIFLAINEKRLDKINIEWSEDCAVCVVMASGGYPGHYQKGYPIDIGALDDNILLFHAGTAIKDNKIVTNGGRVLGVTAIAQDLLSARESAYKNIQKINFIDKHFRKDIGIK
ncbi:MAG TPA: phosphoribosylamine--glycine ligase [Clostridiales bacterium]|nr:phosphoribosylamine--glycine ligase [Clostridiales bacterium]